MHGLVGTHVTRVMPRLRVRAVIAGCGYAFWRGCARGEYMYVCTCVRVREYRIIYLTSVVPIAHKPILHSHSRSFHLPSLPFTVIAVPTPSPPDLPTQTVDEKLRATAGEINERNVAG